MDSTLSAEEGGSGSTPDISSSIQASDTWATYIRKEDRAISILNNAIMSELVDDSDLKSDVRNHVWVRLPLIALEVQ